MPKTSPEKRTQQRNAVPTTGTAFRLVNGVKIYTSRDGAEFRICASCDHWINRSMLIRTTFGIPTKKITCKCCCHVPAQVDAREESRRRRTEKDSDD